MLTRSTAFVADGMTCKKDSRLSVNPFCTSFHLALLMNALLSQQMTNPTPSRPSLHVGKTQSVQ